MDFDKKNTPSKFAALIGALLYAYNYILAERGNIMKKIMFLGVILSAFLLGGCGNNDAIDDLTDVTADAEEVTSVEEITTQELKVYFTVLSNAFTNLQRYLVDNEREAVADTIKEIADLNTLLQSKFDEDESHEATDLLLYSEGIATLASDIGSGNTKNTYDQSVLIGRFVAIISDEYLSGFKPASITMMSREREDTQKDIEESEKEEEETEEEETEEATEASSDTTSVPEEGSTALRKAKEYIEIMPFSKSGLKEQLIFDGFPEEAAAYATENVNANWNSEAVKTAENYSDIMSMSKQELKDQLVFDGFTSEQAQYGIDNMKD